MCVCVCVCVCFVLGWQSRKEVHDHIDNSRYSETPFHKKKQASKVFDVSDYVSRERAIITSGRTFTWGGRMKYDKPPFNPDRSRQIRSQSSF